VYRRDNAFGDDRRAVVNSRVVLQVASSGDSFAKTLLKSNMCRLKTSSHNMSHIKTHDAFMMVKNSEEVSNRKKTQHRMYSRSLHHSCSRKLKSP
jgi:hypothetical protein